MPERLPGEGGRLPRALRAVQGIQRVAGEDQEGKAGGHGGRRNPDCRGPGQKSAIPAEDAEPQMSTGRGEKNQAFFTLPNEHRPGRIKIPGFFVLPKTGQETGRGGLIQNNPAALQMAEFRVFGERKTGAKQGAFFRRTINRKRFFMAEFHRTPKLKTQRTRKRTGRQAETKKSRGRKSPGFMLRICWQSVLRQILWQRQRPCGSCPQLPHRG